MADNIHVIPHDDKWAIKVEGNQKVSSTYTTQGDAIEAGRTRAQGDRVELVIHRPNGQIRDKDSYGRDPFPPKDKKN